jgi:hypothetical protein
MDKHVIPGGIAAKRGHRPVDCRLNKVLTAYIVRQQILPTALCSNDVRQCYDRIVHAIAHICLQIVGGHGHTCRVMLGTIQQMPYYVKIAYGTSATSYGCVHIPLQGILQGNGAGPAIWMLRSLPLIQMLRTQGFGFRSKNLLTKKVYYFVCYTYVNDTDLVHTGISSTPPTQIFEEIQSMLDHWEGGLHATGGALVPQKSYWYGIDFEWHTTKLKWEYTTIAQLPGSLSMKDHQQNITLLERLEVGEARKTLCLWIAMDGNQVQQVPALLKKKLEWADRVQTKQLTKTEA